MMDTTLRRITGALLLGAAGVLLSAGVLMATNTTSQAQALTNCDISDYSLDSEERAFLSLINDYREGNGLNRLSVSTNLNRGAAWMAHDLGTTPNWSHTDSSGRSPYQRAQDCGYPQGAGENLAAGTTRSTAQSAFNAWRSSSGHDANMLNDRYQQIGIARIHVEGSPYGWYWVTKFGATDDGTSGATPAPTSTPEPTNTPVPPTNTPEPTSTPVTPTATPEPANTPTQEPTNTPVPPTSTPQPDDSRGMNPPATSTPEPTPTADTGGEGSGNVYTLQPGHNLIGWNGDSVSPADALKGLDGDVRIIYGYDPGTGQWLRYAPGAPAYVNTLPLMETGKAYWVMSH